MKVLITTWGWRSHFYPLAPLGWALLAAGHTVRVASQPSMIPAITAAGLPAVAVGPPLDFAEVFGGQIGRVATRRERASGVAGIKPAVTADGGVIRYADAMLDDLVAFGRDFEPDLIVHEPQNFAGALAAAALAVPSVRLLWGPDESSQLDLDAERVLGPLAARWNVAIGDVHPAGTLTLDPCPVPMQVPLATPHRPLRFVPYNGPAVVPQWLCEPPARPRICLTWGTMMAGLGLPSLIDVSRVVGAAAELDAEIVLVLETAQQVGLGQLPPNVRLAEAPLALHLLLPTCRALVHQGGAGTMMTGLACGVPQLVLPQVSDQHFNAERLVVTGAGMSLAAQESTPEVVVERMADLLAGGWSAPAAAMRRQIHARPAPAALVPLLEQLARGELS